MKNFKQFILEQLNGVGKDKTLQDFHRKYGPKTNIKDFEDKHFKPALQEGIKIEMEHTKNKAVARKIALDHLWEDIKYYKKLKKIVEQLQAPKTAVFAYGRFNPPTIAHEALIKKLSTVASENNADAYLIPSHTDFFTAKNKQDKIKNPLTLREKIKVLSEIVPSNVIISEQGKFYIDILKYLMNQGYTKVIQIAGSDRIAEFKALVDKYNNKPDKKGNIPFSFESFEFESSGDRDPDAEDISGMSASKLRQLAHENNYEEFIKGVPTKIQSNEKMIKDLFKIIRERQLT